TCWQGGAVLPSSVCACDFCDTSFSSVTFSEDFSACPHSDASGQITASASNYAKTADSIPAIAVQMDQASAWRRELSMRMETYRARQRRRPASTTQSQLPFERGTAPTHALALDEVPKVAADDFSFTIAIGPNTQTREKANGRMEIDVSIPAALRHDGLAALQQNAVKETYGAHPVGSLEERRFAAAIDIACLLFAYGGFLALFGSLGGQFTLSK